MRVYIAGPIKGQIDGNRAAFAKAAKMLSAVGYTPVNPWDISADHDTGECIGPEVDHGDNSHRYGCFLRADIMALMFCDAITMLPGWQNSTGARTEYQVAMALGLKVLRIEEDL